MTNTKAAPTITRGETVRVGRFGTYRGRNPEGTFVTIDGEAFIEINDILYVECGRCRNASGSLPEYMGIYDGVCFDCNGAGRGREVGTVENAAKIARRRRTDRERAARKRDEKAAAQQAEADAWAAAHPEQAAALAEVRADAPDYEAAWDVQDAYIKKWGDLLTSLANQAQFGPLSEKQTALVLPIYEEEKARRAAEADAAAKQRHLDAQVGEKVTVTGTVVVRATYETYYAGPAVLNCLLVIEADGDNDGVTVKVSGTGATLWTAGKGDKVTVTGKVKKHDKYQGTPQTILNYARVTVTEEATA